MHNKKVELIYIYFGFIDMADRPFNRPAILVSYSSGVQNASHPLALFLNPDE